MLRRYVENIKLLLRPATGVRVTKLSGIYLPYIALYSRNVNLIGSWMEKVVFGARSSLRFYCFNLRLADVLVFLFKFKLENIWSKSYHKFNRNSYVTIRSFQSIIHISLILPTRNDYKAQNMPWWIHCFQKPILMVWVIY